jgi:hypothetical protein
MMVAELVVPRTRTVSPAVIAFADAELVVRLSLR